MMYYLASPYTHPNGVIRAQRVIKAKLAVAALTQQGYTVLSPIVYYDEVVQVMPGHGHDFKAFETHNYRMIDRCDAMVVLTLENWRSSHGVQAEIAYCSANAKTVVYLEYDAIEHDDVLDFLMFGSLADENG